MEIIDFFVKPTYCDRWDQPPLIGLQASNSAKQAVAILLWQKEIANQEVGLPVFYGGERLACRVNRD